MYNNDSIIIRLFLYVTVWRHAREELIGAEVTIDQGRINERVGWGWGRDSCGFYDNFYLSILYQLVR